MTNTCFYCNSSDEDLRPYGPNSSFICFPCMKNSPDREQEAARQFEMQLCGGTIMVIDGTQVGPYPLEHLVPNNESDTKCH